MSIFVYNLAFSADCSNILLLAQTDGNLSVLILFHEEVFIFAFPDHYTFSENGSMDFLNYG